MQTDAEITRDYLKGMFSVSVIELVIKHLQSLQRALHWEENGLDSGGTRRQTENYLSTLFCLHEESQTEVQSQGPEHEAVSPPALFHRMKWTSLVFFAFIK